MAAVGIEMDLQDVTTCVVVTSPHRPVGAWILFIRNRELIRFIGTDLESASLACCHHGITNPPIPEQFIAHARIHGAGSPTVNSCARSPGSLDSLGVGMACQNQNLHGL